MNDIIRFRRKTIVVALETSYGVDAVAAGSGAAMQVKDVEFTAIAGDSAARELQLSYYANTGAIPVNTHSTLSFKVELAGSGTAGVAPAYAPLLRACGWAEVVTAETQVDYSPISDDEESVTLYINRDGQLHKLTGSRGSVSLEVANNGIPYLTFAFTSLYNAPESRPSIVPDYSAFQVPVAITQANTPVARLHGHDMCLNTVSFDQANEVTHRDKPNFRGVDISNRVPTGSVTFEEVPISVKDYFEVSRVGSLGDLSIQHGTTAGNIIEINAPAVQPSAPAMSDANGISQLQLSLAFTPIAGNDEITLTFR